MKFSLALTGNAVLLVAVLCQGCGSFLGPEAEGAFIYETEQGTSDIALRAVSARKMATISGVISTLALVGSRALFGAGVSQTDSKTRGGLIAASLGLDLVSLGFILAYAFHEEKAKNYKHLWYADWMRRQAEAKERNSLKRNK